MRFGKQTSPFEVIKDLPVIECETAEIVHKGQLLDGYPTFLRIDGISLPERTPAGWEKEITLIVEACEPLTILAKVLRKPKNYDVYEVYQPKNFNLKLGCLELAIQPDRCPCSIRIGGFEPKCKSLIIRFAEGEMVTPELGFFLVIPEVVRDY